MGYGQIPQANRYGPKPDIKFEWRVDRGFESRLAAQVRQWRFDVCGGHRAYNAKLAVIRKEISLEKCLNDRVDADKPAFSGQGPTARPYIPSTQPQQPQHHPAAGGFRPPLKRSSTSSADAEPGPSSKRRSIGSQSDIPTSPALARPVGMGQHPPMRPGPQTVFGQPSMAPGLWSMRSG